LKLQGSLAAFPMVLVVALVPLGLPVLESQPQSPEGTPPPATTTTPTKSSTGGPGQTAGRTPTLEEVIRLAGVDPDRLAFRPPPGTPQLYQQVARDPLAARDLFESVGNSFDASKLHHLFDAAAQAAELEISRIGVPESPSLAQEVARAFMLRGQPLDATGIADLQAQIQSVDQALHTPLAQLVWALNEAHLLRERALAQVTPQEIQWLAERAAGLAADLAHLGLAPAAFESPQDDASFAPEPLRLDATELARARSIIERADLPALMTGARLLARAIDIAAPVLAAAAPDIRDENAPSRADAARPALDVAREVALVVAEAGQRLREDPNAAENVVSIDERAVEARWKALRQDGKITPDERDAFLGWFRGHLAAAREVNPQAALPAKYLTALQRVIGEAEDEGIRLGSLPAPASHTTCIIDDSDAPLGLILYLCGFGNDVIGPGPEPLLILDLGGNDLWSNTACGIPPNPGFISPPLPGVKVCLDLGGSDLYVSAQTGEDNRWVQGSASGGIALLVDLPLTDRLSCPELLCTGDVYFASQTSSAPLQTVQIHAQGSAVLGVGALIDVGGDDAYTVSAFSVGGRANATGQGQASGLGVGLLVDVLGVDTRLLSAASEFFIINPELGRSGRTIALGQGAGSLIAIGALVDLGSGPGFPDDPARAGDVNSATAFSDGTVFIDLTGVTFDVFFFRGTTGIATVIAQGAGSSTGIGLFVESNLIPERIPCFDEDCLEIDICLAAGGIGVALCQGTGLATSVGLYLGLNPPGFTCDIGGSILCANGDHFVNALSFTDASLIKLDGTGALSVGLGVLVGTASALCQGAGQNFALGGSLEVLGHDDYLCAANAVGTGTTTTLLDDYCPCIYAAAHTTVRTMDAVALAQGAARDVGIGVQLDAEGDDSYLATATTTATTVAIASPDTGVGFAASNATAGAALEFSQGLSFNQNTPLGLALHVDLIGEDIISTFAGTNADALGVVVAPFASQDVEAIARSGDALARDKAWVRGGVAVYLNTLIPDGLGLLGSADFYSTVANTTATATAIPAQPVVEEPGVALAQSYGFSSPFLAGSPHLALFIDLGPYIVGAPPLLVCPVTTGSDTYVQVPQTAPAAWGANGGLGACGTPVTWTQGPTFLGLPTGLGVDA
jgi:hypothetical protein